MSNINDKLTELEAHLDVAEDTTELMSNAEKFGYKLVDHKLELYGVKKKSQ